MTARTTVGRVLLVAIGRTSTYHSCLLPTSHVRDHAIQVADKREQVKNHHSHWVLPQRGKNLGVSDCVNELGAAQKEKRTARIFLPRAAHFKYKIGYSYTFYMLGLCMRNEIGWKWRVTK